MLFRSDPDVVSRSIEPLGGPSTVPSFAIHLWFAGRARFSSWPVLQLRAAAAAAAASTESKDGSASSVTPAAAGTGAAAAAAASTSLLADEEVLDQEVIRHMMMIGYNPAQVLEVSGSPFASRRACSDLASELRVAGQSVTNNKHDHYAATYHLLAVKRQCVSPGWPGRLTFMAVLVGLVQGWQEGQG